MTAEMGIKPPPVKIIAWHVDEGSEGPLKAPAIPRAENETREKEHLQNHHNSEHHDNNNDNENVIAPRK
jgi:hypothetical protein